MEKSLAARRARLTGLTGLFAVSMRLSHRTFHQLSRRIGLMTLMIAASHEAIRSSGGVRADSKSLGDIGGRDAQPRDKTVI